MKKEVIMKKLLPFIMLIFTSCATYAPQSAIVRKSFYLNKSLSKFEIDNGFCYYREKIPNGGYINHFKSSGINIIADIKNLDSYPECKLDLITNNKNIITQIRIVEDDIKCAYILK